MRWHQVFLCLFFRNYQGRPAEPTSKTTFVSFAALAAEHLPPPQPSPAKERSDWAGEGAAGLQRDFAGGEVFPPLAGGSEGGLPQQKPSHRKHTDYVSSYPFSSAPLRETFSQMTTPVGSLPASIIALRTLTGISSSRPTMKKAIRERMATRELPVNCTAAAKTNGPIHDVPRSLIS